MSPASDALLAAWRWACRLDVLVAKPGNVSLASPGHGMLAGDFLSSADVAGEAICAPGGTVGTRIEAAVAATRQAVGCNTNLGIVLLCAPLAQAWLPYGAVAPTALPAAVERVLAGLDRGDARAAYRAIAMAAPGGLGRVAAEDVRDEPAIDLRRAMALAAERDTVARQYRDGFREILDEGLAELAPAAPTLGDAVLRVFMRHLARRPDSHIVRKLGAGIAQPVTEQARDWLLRLRAGTVAEYGEALSAWDKSLKARGINPGTSADMTVATLFCAALLWPDSTRLGADHSWHGFCMASARDERQPAFGRPDPVGGESG
ncbi:MAG: triphosphoribosyl-dephospho-CoA synthase [Rhodocyclaceae bacterium]|nr:triphosphoribosyl-dephospho-CoA synthase [Rhodocyclaceae bacterium]